MTDWMLVLLLFTIRENLTFHESTILPRKDLLVTRSHCMTNDRYEMVEANTF